MSGLQLWQGEARSNNVGPARGERLLGELTGPGLYFFVGPNAGGKSTELRLLERAHDMGLLKTVASVTDGEAEAELVLGPLKITYRRSPSGLMQEPVVEGLPGVIDSLPAAIERLISASGYKGVEPRAKDRLDALLSYAPITSTPELVKALCVALEGKAWPEDLGEDWWRIASTQVRAARFHPLRLRSAAELEAELLTRPRGGILDDHSWMLETLNALGNTGEKAAEQQAKVVAGIDGRLAEALSGAARRLDLPVEGLDRVLAQTYDLAALTAAETAAGRELSRVRAEVAARAGEVARREKLRETMGARPDISPLSDALEKAKAETAAAKAAQLTATTAQAMAASDLSGSGAELRVADAAFGPAVDSWKAAAERATTALLSLSPEDPARQVSEAKSALEFAEEARSKVVAARTETGRLAAIHDERSADAERLRTISAAAIEREGAARTALNRAQAELSRWEQLAAELASPLEGPESFEAEEEAHSGAFAALELAREAQAYQVIAAEREQAQTLLERLTLAASDYRAAARDTWTALGAAVTRELRLPWLQVDGLDLYVGYVGGQLNNDLDLIERAEAQVRALAAEDVNLAGVSLQRFVLERIRDASAVEWRSIDSVDRMSTAELHEAALSVFLERKKISGNTFTCPWNVLAALDQDKLEKFAGRLEEAGLTCFSERPWRRGDEPELRLEKVEGVR